MGSVGFEDFLALGQANFLGDDEEVVNLHPAYCVKPVLELSCRRLTCSWVPGGMRLEN